MFRQQPSHVGHGPADGLPRALLPDAGGNPCHDRLPLILVHFAVDATVGQHPDAPLEQGDENEHAGFIPGAVQAVLEKVGNGRFFPLFVDFALRYEKPFEGRCVPHESQTGREQQAEKAQDYYFGGGWMPQTPEGKTELREFQTYVWGKVGYRWN